MYTDIAQKELITGIKYWRNPKNKFHIIMMRYSADPDKDPKRQGAEWLKKEQASTSDYLWKKEYEIDFTTKSGKLIYGPEFCDYNPSKGHFNPHWVEPFEWAEPIELLLSLDFGQRNPTAALVGIWNENEELYIVDEYYKPALPSVSSKEMFKKFDYLLGDKDFLHKTIDDKRDIANERFQLKIIDPSTLHKNRTAMKQGEEIPYSVQEDFYDNGWDFEPASNNVDAGITRVREYMRVNPITGKPRLMFFRGKLPRLEQELKNYRYKTLTELQSKTRDDPEEPIKKDDHLMDALRYMIMTRPNKPQSAEKPKTIIQKDIEALLRPKIISNDWDDDSNY